MVISCQLSIFRLQSSVFHFMQLPKHRLSLLVVSSLLCFLVNACGENKLIQCNKIIQVANKFETIATDVTKDAAGFEKIAAQIDEISKEMQTLKVDNETLGGFRDRFVQIYQETSQSMREISKAIGARNATKIAKATESLKATVAKETSLNGEINRYCIGG
jgi:hypothetical protein